MAEPIDRRRVKVPPWQRNEMRNETLELAARLCEEKVRRDAGYDGQWEGYGPFDGDKTGPECAASIRALMTSGTKNGRG